MPTLISRFTFVILRVVMAAALVGLGMMVGRAQDETAAGDFSLRIDAPVGETRIVCVRGCTLQAAVDAGNPNNVPVPQFMYRCGGASVTRCGATIAGHRTP